MSLTIVLSYLLLFPSISAGSVGFSDDLPHSTITPNINDIIEGAYTVSVPLPSSTSLEIDIEWNFDKYNKVTLVGPTTFVSVVRWRTIAAPSGSTASTSSRSFSSNTGAVPLWSGPPTNNNIKAGSTGTSDQKNAAAGSPASIAPTMASQTASRNSNSSSTSRTSTTAAPIAPGMDPDSYMAQMYASAYANDTWNSTEFTTYAPAPILKEECILWDPTCKTNISKEQAAEEFWGVNGTMFKLLSDPCFGNDYGDIDTNCTSSLLVSSSMILSSSVRDYMRKPACTNDYRWYQETLHPGDLSSTTTTLTDTDGSQTVEWPWGSTSYYPPGPTTVVQTAPASDYQCCGQCEIYGPNVEVYYWPEPNADDSCLSIIGDKVNPPLEGAKTDNAGDVWWGTVTNPLDIYVGTHTTARIVTINGITVKQAVVNPWDDGEGTDMPPITTTRPLSTSPTQEKTKSTITAPPIIARARPRLIKRDIPGLNGTSPHHGNIADSIAILDGHTFTSPSVYVAFTDLKASDLCGYRGIGTIHSTLLAFTPGELSTVQGAIFAPVYNPPKPVTKVFDFADLPCPPRSVMEADWYKPAPGEPYRPFIALPDKVRSLDPWWLDCTDAFYFTGLDPPRALVAATEVADPGAPAMPELPQKTDPASNEHCKDCPAPGIHEPASMLVGPANSPKPAPSPASTPDTPVIEPTPGPGKPDDAPKETSPQQTAPKEAMPKGPATEVASADPAKEAAPIGSAVALQFGYSEGQADPNQMSDEQMSKLNQALSPASSPSPDLQQQSHQQSQPQAQAQAQPGPQQKQDSQGQSGSGSQPQPEGGREALPVAQSQSQPNTSSNNVQIEPAVAGSNPAIPPLQANPNEEQQPSQHSEAPAQSENQSPGPVDFAPQPVHVVLGSSTFELPEITTNPLPVINGEPVVQLPNGKHQVGNTILSAGGPPAIVEGTTVRVNKQGAAVVDGQTYGSQPTAATSVVSGHTIINNGASGVKVDGVSLPTGDTAPAQIGGTPVQINKQGTPIVNGQTYSKLPSAGSTQVAGHTFVASDYGYAVDGHQIDEGAPPVVVGAIPAHIVYTSPPSNKASSGIELPAGSPSAATTFPGGQEIQIKDGVYQIANQPLSKGGPPVVVSGSTYSLDPSNSVHVNNQVFSLPKITSAPAITIAGQAVVPLPSGVSIAGHTLHIGDAPITLSNSIPVSLGSSELVIGSSTVPVYQQAVPSLPTISVAGHILTQAPNNGGFAVSGTTILPGSSTVIISGTPYSLAPSGSALVVGTSTFALATSSLNGPLVAAGETFTPLGASAVAIDGSTLSISGLAITDSKGTIISFAADGLVVGSSTFVFANTPTSSSAGTTTTASSLSVAAETPASTAAQGSVGGSTSLPPPTGGTGLTGTNAHSSEAPAALRKIQFWRSIGFSAVLVLILVINL